MTRRRAIPLAVAAAATVLVACLGGTELKAVPYGFITLTARQAGTTYRAVPVGSFFSAAGLGVPAETSPWDSCRLQTYTSANSVSVGDVYPFLDAGPSIEMKLPGRTDSLFPGIVSNQMEYATRSNLSVPYTPGDSVSFVVPGTSSGFPAISFKAKTAEALLVTDFGTPAAGTRIDLRWNAGQDLNATMAIALRYGALNTDTLNSQVYCQFRDDGTDSIPAKYVSAWAAAKLHSWVATRVRTYLAPVSRGGYFDFISTFDVPTIQATTVSAQALRRSAVRLPSGRGGW